MKDGHNRTIDYMRVSVTDRCNYRCGYCMPDGCEKVSMSQILTYEEILHICRAAISVGIKKFKVTGGEPLVRRGCVEFIKALKALEGAPQVTLTTNGELLEEFIPELVEAKVDGVNISIDSLKPARFKMLTGGGELSKVLASLDASIASGLKTKVNCVIQQGINTDEILDLAQIALDKGIPVRFIELMPIGFGDKNAGVSNGYILELLTKKYGELIPDVTTRGNGPAKYYRLPESEGCIGFISAVHGIFCDECNRIRLTSQGLIKPCLCYEDGVDLMPYINGNDYALVNAIKEGIQSKPKCHCFNDNLQIVEHKPMSQIGG